MKLQHKILSLLSVGVLAMPALSLGSAAQTFGSEPDEGLEVQAEAAAAEEVTPDSLLTLAADSFKALQLLKHEGTDDGTLYPEAYHCYEQAVDALRAQQRGDRGWLQCKEILRELDNDLLRGAFYYSKNERRDALNQFARGYVDIQLLPEFEGDKWDRNPQIFPFVTYIAATDAFNGKQWQDAINYFKLYIASGATEHREKIFLCMGQACVNLPDYPLAISTMKTAMEQYPANDVMPMMGIQACVDGGHAQYLQEFLTKALEKKPADEQLLTLQGKLYEDQNNYRQAIDVFSQLDQIKPNSLTVAKHLGMNFYNLAVSHFHQAINESDEKQAKKQRRQSKNYFDAAAIQFRQVLDTDPMDVTFMKHLAVCYLCLEDKSQFERLNEKLTMLGADPLSDDMLTPPVMSYSDAGGKNFAWSDFDTATGGNSFDVPSYSAFAEKYVTEALQKWAFRKEFEPVDDYSKRVNEKTIKEEHQRLSRKAADEYLAKYGNKLHLSDIKIAKDYDAVNEVFEISTNYGPVVVHVPIKNGEAEMFKATFAGVNIRAPKYYVDESGVKLASLTFVTPGGKSYTYDDSKALTYQGAPQIDIDFNSILRKQTPMASNTTAPGSKITIQRKSDVDENIPASSHKNPNRIALVIANENYVNVPQVASAINDGQTFAEYCKQTMGLPETNVTLLTDGTLGNIVRSVKILRDKVEAIGPEAEVVVYYAGHGMPDENTKDAYILPVDSDPTTIQTCYPLNQLYETLGNMNAKSIAVFIDACFSGAQRNSQGDMLASARAVVIKPKEAAPKGNMMVLTAASGNETALPYAEKNHGLFTYYLLKKIQESKGNVTLRELSDYVISNVKRQSALINSKPQTPTVTTSGTMSNLWQSLKIKP